MSKIDDIYRKVKQVHPDVYREVVQITDVFGINNKLDITQTAELEKSIMMMVYVKFCKDVL